jgi:hypothetical protein
VRHFVGTALRDVAERVERVQSAATVFKRGCVGRETIVPADS